MTEAAPLHPAEERRIHTRDGECLHCTAQNEIIGEGKTMKTEAAKVPDVLAPYVTVEGEGIRLNPRGADGLTIAVLVLPTAKYDSWHTMLPKILDRAPKSSFGTTCRLFFLVKDVPDGADTSICDNEVTIFLGGFGFPFPVGEWSSEPHDELPIITYAEVKTLMGIRDVKPEVAQNAPAGVGVLRIGKTKKKNLPKTEQEPERWWEDIHRKVARGELKVEDATTTEAGPKILELVATKAAETAAKHGVLYDEFVTPDKLRSVFGCTDAYQVCCSEDVDIDPIITTAVEVGRRKYNELKAADTENAKVGLGDVLALDSGNGLTNSAAELVVVDVEEPNVKALPPWKREIVINAKFEDCGVARAFNRHRHTFDDEGNANRFEDECGEWVRFDKSSKQWIIWKAPDGTKQKTGNHWEPADELLKQAARFVGRSVSAEKGKWADPQNDTIAKQFDKHANHSANHRTQNDMLAMAAANMTVDLRKETNYDLIACRNGIFDSKNGRFYPLEECEQFKTTGYPTVYIDAVYTEGSMSEKWIEHLNTVMTDNTTEGLPVSERDNRRDELVEYLRRLFGYGLYAGNPERIFVCFYGDGRNGKSTTTETVTAVLDGQTGKPALSQIFSTKEDKPAPSVAAALPKRFAFFTELGGTGKIDVAMVKELTGETETERFRGMGKDNEKLPIYCLPIATTNESPQFDKEVDDALLTRLIIIPFKHRFEGEKHDVLSELVAEKDKIFSMMVDECIKCRKREASGEKFLPVPDCAKMTGKELLVGSDRYLFLTTILEPTDGKAETDRMNRKEIAECYLKWAEGVGIEVSTQPDKDGEKALTKNERGKLFNAMKIYGYTEAKIKGTRYFRVRRKTE